jgi:hypothetical protein
MQAAFFETYKDPEFVADANKRGLGINSPRSGKALQELLEQVYQRTPAHIVERLRKIAAP